MDSEGGLSEGEGDSKGQRERRLGGERWRASWERSLGGCHSDLLTFDHSAKLAHAHNGRTTQSDKMLLFSMCLINTRLGTTSTSCFFIDIFLYRFD